MPEYINFFKTSCWILVCMVALAAFGGALTSVVVLSVAFLAFAFGSPVNFGLAISLGFGVGAGLGLIVGLMSEAAQNDRRKWRD